jgi:phosphoribosyl 1,2-cyclic phosphate phosphodiesterase
MGKTTVLIDSGPDMRQQLLRLGVSSLDGVVYTHFHADHVNGIDDLRMIVINIKKRLTVWADKKTKKRLLLCFDYAFKQLKGTSYPPILDIELIKKQTVKINGMGGEIELQPIKVRHGEINALGFRVKDVAYIPDISEFYKSSWNKLTQLKILIIDALRYRPHPSHAHVEKTLSWIKQISPKISYLTNMNTELDYSILNSETPKNVKPAYDGLSIEIFD